MSTNQDGHKKTPSDKVCKDSSTEAKHGSDNSSNNHVNEVGGFIKIIRNKFYWMAFMLVLLLAVAGAVWVPNFTAQEIDHHELRLMLVGKTGAGKSASANTILGENAFRVETSPVPGSSQCKKRNKIIRGRNIAVIDTPGFEDTWLTSNKTVHYIPECFQNATFRPHIFLFVIQVGRFTEEERNAVKWFKETFGETALKFTIILFTGGDMLNGKPVDDLISKSYELKSFVDTCDGRYHTFNNYDQKKQIQVTELFQKIQKTLNENLGYHTKEVVQHFQQMSCNNKDNWIKRETFEKEKLEKKITQLTSQLNLAFYIIYVLLFISLCLVVKHLVCWSKSSWLRNSTNMVIGAEQAIAPNSFSN